MQLSGTLDVRSIDEEDALIGACVCGGAWSLSANTVYPARQRWLDSVSVRCPTCGSEMNYVFDISNFFRPRPGVWSPQMDSPALAERECATTMVDIHGSTRDCS